MEIALLTTQQVAERLGKDSKTILRYIHAGKLKAVRIGRDYRIAEVALGELLARPTASTLPRQVPRLAPFRHSSATRPQPWRAGMPGTP